MAVEPSLTAKVVLASGERDVTSKVKSELQLYCSVWLASLTTALAVLIEEEFFYSNYLLLAYVVIGELVAIDREDHTLLGTFGPRLAFFGEWARKVLDTKARSDANRSNPLMSISEAFVEEAFLSCRAQA